MDHRNIRTKSVEAMTPADYDELVKRLREVSRATYPVGDVTTAEAAAALESLQAENERLRGALKLYANPENWENDTVDIGVGYQPIPDSSYCSHDHGETARTALATERAAHEATKAMLAEDRETVRAHGEEIFRLQARAERMRAALHEIDHHLPLGPESRALRKMIHAALSAGAAGDKT